MEQGPVHSHGLNYPSSTQFNDKGEVIRFGVREHIINGHVWLECLGCPVKWEKKK